MSVILCRHASMRKGKIYLTIKSSDDDESFEKVEYDKGLNDLREMVINGQIRFTRKPVTKLEKSLASLGKKYDIVQKLRLLAKGMDDVFAQSIIWEAIEVIQDDSCRL